MESRTPRNKIKVALRRLWLYSREHSQALKRDGYKCCKCGIKKSKKKDAVVKVEVHHKKGIKCWDEVIEKIREEILCDPSELETLCVQCHREKEKEKKDHSSD